VLVNDIPASAIETRTIVRMIASSVNEGTHAGPNIVQDFTRMFEIVACWSFSSHQRTINEDRHP
jgi:hypothetical protein